MQQLNLTAQAVTYQTYGALLRLAGRERQAVATTDAKLAVRDRGAVSLEQVLWFVAAGVSVAVVAGILWAAIKDKADDPINPPAAP
jgi:hypothetical protein